MKSFNLQIIKKLFGVSVSQDLRWDHNIRSSVSVLTYRLNALKIISSVASFKVRKIMANKIFMTSLIYVIQLWEGANKSLISLLQIQQNKAARFVTHLEHRTSVKNPTPAVWMVQRQAASNIPCLLVCVQGNAILQTSVFSRKVSKSQSV